MVEAGGAAGAARIDVEADVTVADRDRRGRALQLGRLHAEDGLIELGELCVIVADDGDVIDLR